MKLISVKKRIQHQRHYMVCDKIWYTLRDFVEDDIYNISFSSVVLEQPTVKYFIFDTATEDVLTF